MQTLSEREIQEISRRLDAQLLQRLAHRQVGLLDQVDDLNSISFFLRGFESQGLAHTASDPKVPGFSAAVKASKNPRRFVIRPIFPLKTKSVASTS